MKSNGGTLVIDDFGRQRVAPQDLLNRWIVPLERRVDYLALHTGKRSRCLLSNSSCSQPTSMKTI